MDPFNCPVTVTTHIIGGKWKPSILYYLQGGRRHHFAQGVRAGAAARRVFAYQTRRKPSANSSVDVCLGQEASRAAQRGLGIIRPDSQPPSCTVGDEKHPVGIIEYAVFVPFRPAE